MGAAGRGAASAHWVCAGSASTASRLHSGSYPATIPEASVAAAGAGPAGLAPDGPPGAADSGGAASRQRPMSAVELRTSPDGAPSAALNGRTGCGPRAQSASAGLPGRSATCRVQGGQFKPGEATATRDMHEPPAGVSVWAGTGCGPIVTQVHPQACGSAWLHHLACKQHTCVMLNVDEKQSASELIPGYCGRVYVQ